MITDAGDEGIRVIDQSTYWISLVHGHSKQACWYQISTDVLTWIANNVDQYGGKGTTVLTLFQCYGISQFSHFPQKSERNVHKK